MNELKIYLCIAIENKKQKTIKEYDEQIKQIQNTDNTAIIYRLLAETFHNTIKQRKLQIKVLQQYLKNDFFKTATINNRVNYITFYNDEFRVSFSTSLCKDIEIKFNNCGTPPYYSSILKEETIKLGDLIEKYLKNKSLKNFKILMKYNCKNRKNTFVNKLMGYINTYKRCNKELLNSIKDKQCQNEINKLKYEAENKLFQDKQTYAKNFVDSLSDDLKIFQDNNWNIKLKGIIDSKGNINY